MCMMLFSVHGVDSFSPRLALSVVVQKSRVTRLWTRPDLELPESRGVISQMNRIIKRRRLRLSTGRYELLYDQVGNVWVTAQPAGSRVEPVLIAAAEPMDVLLAHFADDLALWPPDEEILGDLVDRIRTGIYSACLGVVTDWTGRIRVRAIGTDRSPTQHRPSKGAEFFIDFPILRDRSPWRGHNLRRFESHAQRLVPSGIARAFGEARSAVKFFLDHIESEAVPANHHPALVVVPPPPPPLPGCTEEVTPRGPFQRTRHSDH